MILNRKKAIRFIPVIVYVAFLLSCSYDKTQQDNLWNITDNYDKEEVYITMRDGIRLFTSIYTPKDTLKTYPILIQRTPYNIEPDPDKFSARLKNMSHLLKEGYIMVFQDVRGRYMSEGEYMDIRPFNPEKTGKETDENSDTFDTIDWLIENVKNNNGNVGVFGISYPGFYSTLSLPQAHPALKAVSPQAPVTNWFIGDDFHHNGAFFLMDAFNFYIRRGFGRPLPGPTREKAEDLPVHSKDNYRYFLELGTFQEIMNTFVGDTIAFWPDILEHPDYDEFWQSRDPRHHLVDVKPAVLVVGGWFDAEDLFGPLNVYKSIEKQNPQNENHLVMGPWSHGQWSDEPGENLGNIYWDNRTSEYFKQLELNFFNYYLKDIGNMNLPEATIFVTGSNEWHKFDSWPPENTDNLHLYLQNNNHLSFSEPELQKSYDEYVGDPDNPVPYTEDVHYERTTEYLTDDQRFAWRRPDVMKYESEVLTEDVTVTGPLKVKLYVSTSGTDADYVVKLIDVFPDTLENYPKNDKNVPMAGYQMLVRGEVLRGRYRNSFENPEPFVPGKITEVSFEIPDLAHTFKKGHRIMVQIQNSWFPLVDRNPQQFVNIYTCDESDYIKATHRIYHDRDHPSHIEVMILHE